MILAFLFVVPFASAQAQTIDRVEIVETGVYAAKIQKVDPSPRTATGTVNTLATIDLVRKTTRIEAKVGTRFGFRYRIVGEPKDGKANLTFVTLPPAPGLKNPKTGTVSTRETYSAPVFFNATGYTGYTLDDDWEIVPGIWTFELWDGERKLATQSFEVVKP